MIPLYNTFAVQKPRRVTGARARTRPARPVGATRIRARPRGPGDSTRELHEMLNAGSRLPPLSLSFSPPTFLAPIWRCPPRAVGARPRSGVSALPTPLDARRVPYRARKSRPPTTCRRCTRRTTPSAAGAALPRFTGGAHARPHRQRWEQWKAKRRWTGPVQFGVIARTRRCGDVSSWRAGPRLVRGA